MTYRSGPTTERLAICLIVPDADVAAERLPRAAHADLPELLPLAALTPAGHEVTVLRDRGATLDWARLCKVYDVIALTGTLRQRRRLLEVLGMKRDGAATICVAGSIVDDDEPSLAAHCNVRFVGPLDKTWPRFIDDLAAGRRPLRRYGRPTVPLPRLSWAALTTRIAGPRAAGASLAARPLL